MIHKSTLAITTRTSKNYNFVTEICIKCNRGESIKFKKKETIKLCKSFFKFRGNLVIFRLWDFWGGSFFRFQG